MATKNHDYQLGEEITTALADVGLELKRARERYPAMNSAHEGYAVILEELDELWEEVRKKPDLTSVILMREEAKQVAAMACRFIIDVCDRLEKEQIAKRARKKR